MRQYCGKRTLKRLLKLRTNPLRHVDLKNKLEILAVKGGIKPAFQGHADASSPDLNDNIPMLKRAGAIVGLYCRLTDLPPAYFSKKPNVKSSFLNVWNNITFAGKAIWLYRDTQVEPMISKSINGELNEGYVLGYPECCIKWHKETRVHEVESLFQDIEQYIIRNPLALHSLHVETEEQMYDALLHTPFYREREEAVFKSIDEHILETMRRYPFVSHWACSSCLSGKSKETKRLNDRYEELAMSLSPKLAREIIRSLLEVFKQMETLEAHGKTQEHQRNH